jgi:hypothetical protein
MPGKFATSYDWEYEWSGGNRVGVTLCAYNK